MGERDVTVGRQGRLAKQVPRQGGGSISILPLSVSAPSPWPEQTDNTAFTQAAQQLAFFPWVLFAVSSLPVPVSRTRPAPPPAFLCHYLLSVSCVPCSVPGPATLA